MSSTIAQTLFVVREVVGSMEAVDRQRFEAAATELREVMKRHGDVAVLAAGLVSAEMAEDAG